MYHVAWQQVSYRFADLKELMAKATPPRSGDILAGVAAHERRGERRRQDGARRRAAEAVPRARPSSPTRPTTSPASSSTATMRRPSRPVSHMTVGEFRDWLLSDAATTKVLTRLAPGLTPEMVAATSKIMRNQDLILAARKKRGRHPLPRHHRPQGPHVGAPAAQSSDRRPARHRRLHRRRPHARLRRRRDRHQPGERQRGDDPRSPRACWTTSSPASRSRPRAAC